MYFIDFCDTICTGIQILVFMVLIMSEEKLIVRRQKIFSALDNMKEEKEKISAQKLAAKVSMGKQTVLPIYREWLEMESITEAEQVELSDNLQQALKREIAKEKFTLAEEYRVLNEHFHEKSIALQEKEELLIRSNTEWEEKERAFIERTSQLQQSLENQKNETARQEEVARESNKQLDIQSVMITNAKKQLEDAHKDKEQALREQEKQLDKAHQTLLDHWITTVDSERKEKERLQQRLEEARANEATTHKQVLSLEHNAIQLKEDIKRLHNELTTQEQENRLLCESKESLQSIASVLHHPKDMTAHIHNLMATAADHRKVVEHSSKLESELAFAEQEVKRLKAMTDQHIQTEQEVIKLKAYIEGMQKKPIR